MSPIESIIYMIWRGLAVGILISAPMGPVGILCIQRTLDKGRHAGFYTGIGAAISDIFYCLLTGFGLSFIEEFIERNQNVIQLVGSVVLIAFSIYLFRKDPSSPLRKPVSQNISARKNILGGFLFTFSNPLIIFLIIGLFARFNFTSPEIKGAYYAIGYVFIVIGALAWWYGITYAIEKVRSRFNMRAMKIMNITIGVVILIFACVGIYSSVTGLVSADAQAANPVKTLYLHPGGDNMPTDTIPAGSEEAIEIPSTGDFTLDLKMRRLDCRPQLRDASTEIGSLLLCGTVATGAPDTLRLRLKVTDDRDSYFNSDPTLICDASATGGIIVSGDVTATKGFNLPCGWNHYRVGLSPDRGLSVKCGSVTLMDLLEIPAAKLPAGFTIRSLSVAAPAGSRLELRDMRLRIPQTPMLPILSADEALQRIELSSDPAEGIWEVLDWSLETKNTRKGGDYRLATVRNPYGDYEIIYLSGATTMPQIWSRGMLKGRLSPTSIPYVYKLLWIDAEGNQMERELSAQLLPTQGVLTLNFPFLESSIRLKRVD